MEAANKIGNCDYEDIYLGLWEWLAVDVVLQ
jgi:hypothetical protein